MTMESLDGSNTCSWYCGAMPMPLSLHEKRQNISSLVTPTQNLIGNAIHYRAAAPPRIQSAMGRALPRDRRGCRRER